MHTHTNLQIKPGEELRAKAGCNIGTAVVRQKKSCISLQMGWTPPCLSQIILNLGPDFLSASTLGVRAYALKQTFHGAGGFSHVWSLQAPAGVGAWGTRPRRGAASGAGGPQAPERQSTSVHCSWLQYLFSLDFLCSQLSSGTTWEPVCSPRGLWTKLMIIVGTFINCLLFPISYTSYSTYGVWFSPFSRCVCSGLSLLWLEEDLEIGI